MSYEQDFILALALATSSTFCYGANIYSINYESSTIKAASDDFRTMHLNVGDELVLNFKEKGNINAKVTDRQPDNKITFEVERIENLRIRDSFEVVVSEPDVKPAIAGNKFITPIEINYFISDNKNVYDLTELGIMRYMDDELKANNSELYRELKLRVNLNQTRNFVGIVVAVPGMAVGLAMVALAGVTEPKDGYDEFGLKFGLAGLGLFFASAVIGKTIVTDKNDVVVLIDYHNRKNGEHKLDLLNNELVNPGTRNEHLGFSVAVSRDLTASLFSVRYSY